MYQAKGILIGRRINGKSTKTIWWGVGLKRQSGFTLLELMVVLAIISIIAALTTPNMISEINQRRAELTAAETTMIMDAARSYRIDKGAWPGNATCSDAISVLRNSTPAYLAGITVMNKYNSPYSSSCTAKTFSLDQNAVKDYDGLLVNLIAGTEIVAPDVYQIRTTIGVPGSEPALDAKLSRIATGNAELNRMRTTLYLGGNNINEVNTINAVGGSFSGGVQTRTLNVQEMAAIAGALGVQGESQFSGKATFKQGIVLDHVVVEGAKNCSVGAVARDADGMTLSCYKGVWTRTPAARTFELTTGVVFPACTYDGWDTYNVLNYDYPRYQTVCGSRYCKTQGYTFGLVTEFNAGFDYNRPGNSLPNTVITVQCVN
ncbi:MULTISPECIES: competence type IV pilus major pilin ComGC [Pseudomonas]|uniref:competence type IV pilus major pilin ComGC n=1 Tax=Pseudomonas TaxID=286 RepID=UPI001F3EFA47|nr:MULTISPECIES: type II secretion system protein [Pseudomonas]WNZ87442.1 prepilin-type N-terminal cleavage/methylation domain-containing protein [Pseudomonas sp. P108]